MGVLFKERPMSDSVKQWLVPVCYLICLVGSLFLLVGCTAHLELKTHAQQWETQRDRYSLNRSADEVTVKSMRYYRDKYGPATARGE